MVKVGFLESAPGRKSSTRLRSMLSFLVGCLIAVSGLFLEGVTFGDSFPLVITFLSYSLGAPVFKDYVSKINGKDVK